MAKKRNLWVMSAMVLAFGIFSVSCASNPYTKRSAFVYINPESGINDMAKYRYDSFVAEIKSQIITGTPEAQEIQEVSERLIDAAQKWATANGKPNYLKNFKWQVSLVKDDNFANAFCMAGGKIVVFTGILPITENVDGLAAILGHEIAHALLKHEWEDFTSNQFKHVATMNAQSVGGTGVGDITNLAINYLGTLPHSRNQEIEADTVGLTLMLIAGYNGEEASAVWTRMSAHGGGGKSDFTSTHPSDEKRVDNLKNELPVAQETAKKVLEYKLQ
jgi:predicted Zn-dependent protease